MEHEEQTLFLRYDFGREVLWLPTDYRMSQRINLQNNGGFSLKLKFYSTFSFGYISHRTVRVKCFCHENTSLGRLKTSLSTDSL
jgi:hypothetical protein